MFISPILLGNKHITLKKNVRVIERNIQLQFLSPHAPK